MIILCHWPRLFASILVGIISGGECVYPILGMFCAQPVFYPQQVYLNIVDRLILRGYDGCIGRNSVWMTNRSAFFARSIQC